MKAKDRNTWRQWLTKHHAATDTMWLVFARKDAKEPSIAYAEAVEEALCFGWIDGVAHRIDATHFALRFTTRKARSIWSKLNVERVAKLQQQGLMQPAGQKCVDAAKASGAWDQAYRVSDDVEMPAALARALEQNKRAKALFDSLTKAAQRAWMRQVLSVKNAREKKAAEVVALLLGGRKPGETDNQAARRGIKSKAELFKWKS